MINLHLIRVRAALKPRNEPYWSAPLGKRGRVVGYRKVDTNTGSWIARMRDESNRKRSHFLGADAPGFGYEQACEAARKWFNGCDAGVTDEEIRVEDACREYVTNRREVKGEACADDAEQRFERTVYGKPFGAIKVAKLRTPRIEEWRRDTGLGKASANRTLRSLKAALNHAVRSRRVRAEVAREWGDVKLHHNADGRRDLYLDVKQRRALLDRTQGALRDLIEAAIRTGARPGELASATRGQFDERTKTMTFIGKTGRRDVPLSPSAAALFARLARSKLPAAHLLVRDDGQPWYRSDWARLVTLAAKLAGLPAGTCLYTMRHSFITSAITGGMTTLDVARLTGTSLAMIDAHYGHLVADAARERLAAVNML
jgi:integrase